MALYVGDTAIRRVYHGTTPIKRIYQGDTLLWSALGTATGLSSTRNNTSFTPAWPAVDGADSYDLRWSTSSDMSNPTLVTGTTSGTAVTGLSALTTYYWQVRANEGNIEGDWSATQSVTTTGTLSGLSSTRTRTSFTPSWNAIAGLAYDMRWSTNSDMTSATTVTGTTSGTAVTGLDSSTTYYWEVRSKRGSTNGAWSSTQSVTTQAPLTAPARGAAPSATGSLGQMEWVATAPDNGGSAITSYQWRWRQVGAVSWRTTVTTTGRTFTRTGLSNGTQYEAQFKAVNTIGAAASWSPSGTATTTSISVPAQGLAPSASGGNKQMRWQASAPNNGGSAITGYDWRWRQVGTLTWTTLSTVGGVLTRTGLAADTRYEAQFKAKNAIGTADDWSPSGTGRTDAATVPARGAAPSATGGNQQVRWDVTAPDNGGSAITGYDWRWRRVGAVSWTTLSTSNAVLIRTGLTANTQYEAQFKAKNIIGTAANWSPSGRATTDQVAAAPSQTFTATTLNKIANTASRRSLAILFGNEQITESGLTDGAATRYARQLAIVAPTSGGNYGLNLNISSNEAGTSDGDLSSAFETGWEIVVAVGAQSETFSHDDFNTDTAATYAWRTADTTVQAALRNIFARVWATTAGNVSVTLTIP